MADKPIGLVLAGGLGRRMGRAKGGLEVGGRSLAARAASALDPICERVLISIRPGAANPAPGYPHVEDRPPSGRGPLAGIESGFRASGAANLLVVACDYPAIRSELLRRLLVLAQGAAGAQVVIPTDRGGRDHPLLGLWRRSAERPVEAALAAGRYRVTDLVEGLIARRLEPAEFGSLDLDELLINANTAAELRDLRARGRRSGGSE